MQKINLARATEFDSKKIREMQILAFKSLLDKYQDFETNPGAETLDRVRERFQFPQIEHYFILKAQTKIGYLRVRILDETANILSTIFILPKFQGYGYAQQALAITESLYPSTKIWLLDTIKQESALCYLYEKLGYKPTGEEKNIKSGMDLIYYIKLITD